jgi:hypothetical protein
MAKLRIIQSSSWGVAAMKRLGVLLCALFVALAFSGCASDGKKGQWDDFWKDVRGDNMEMKSDFSAFK